MSFADSFNFLTGNATSNDRAAKRDANEQARYDRLGGSDRNASFVDQYTNPDNANYMGPGWQTTVDDDGHATAHMVDQAANDQWKADKAAAAAAQPAVDPNAAIAAAYNQPPTNPNAPKQAVDISAAGAIGNDFNASPLTGSRRTAATGQPDPQYLSQFDLQNVKGGGANPNVPTGAQAPVANRERIDPLLDGINNVQQKLLGLADETNGMSAAEAALHKAGREADLRSAFGVEGSQRSALGAARGARNRGDRALLERQAIGDASFIGQEAARTDALRTAEQEGNIAQLRAGEEDADRRFKAEILGKAADLGLNTAAVEVDLSKVNLSSATNWINNQFDQLKAQGQLDLGYAQLDEQKSEAILGFTKDMASLQFEYDKLSVEDQNATDALLMQKYGIDQQTMLGLKQIKASTGMNWGQILTAVIGGVGSGATAAIAKTSDQRLKTEIRQVDPGELEELLDTVKAETWRYQDDDEHARDGTRGMRLGPMAQDLQKSKLGRSMVAEQPGGFLAVDSGRAGLAALSGLALVYDKLKQLEGRA